MVESVPVSQGATDHCAPAGKCRRDAVGQHRSVIIAAVHTSNVEPLPHQITAVYESLLPRQPLRFVLADDPGAGKTIMARLYIPS